MDALALRNRENYYIPGLYLISTITLMVVLLSGLIPSVHAEISADEWNDIGESYLDDVDYDAAISAFLNAVSIKSDYPEAWNNLGLSYQYDSQYNRALSAFKRVVALEPEYIEAWNSLGYIYELLNRPEDASFAFQKAATLSNNNSKGYFHPPYDNRGEQLPRGITPGIMMNQPPGAPIPAMSPAPGSQGGAPQFGNNPTLINGRFG